MVISLCATAHTKNPKTHRRERTKEYKILQIKQSMVLVYKATDKQIKTII